MRVSLTRSLTKYAPSYSCSATTVLPDIGLRSCGNADCVHRREEAVKQQFLLKEQGKGRACRVCWQKIQDKQSMREA